MATTLDHTLQSYLILLKERGVRYLKKDAAPELRSYPLHLGENPQVVYITTKRDLGGHQKDEVLSLFFKMNRAIGLEERDVSLILFSELETNLPSQLSLIAEKFQPHLIVQLGNNLYPECKNVEWEKVRGESYPVLGQTLTELLILRSLGDILTQTELKKEIWLDLQQMKKRLVRQVS